MRPVLASYAGSLCDLAILGPSDREGVAPDLKMLIRLTSPDGDEMEQRFVIDSGLSRFLETANHQIVERAWFGGVDALKDSQQSDPHDGEKGTG